MSRPVTFYRREQLLEWRVLFFSCRLLWRLVRGIVYGIGLMLYCTVDALVMAAEVARGLDG